MIAKLPRERIKAETLKALRNSVFQIFSSEEAYALVAAREGYFTPLEQLLLGQRELSPKVRRLLVEILQGKVKRPRNRPPRLTTLARHLMVASHVRLREREGIKQMSAIREAMKEFHCAERTVKKALDAERQFHRKVASMADASGRIKITDDDPVLAIVGAIGELVVAKSRLKGTRKR